MQRRSLVVSDGGILGGILVFVGARVPVKTLSDYLKTDHPLDDFLDDSPTVGRAQAEAILEINGRRQDGNCGQGIFLCHTFIHTDSRASA